MLEDPAGILGNGGQAKDARCRRTSSHDAALDKGDKDPKVAVGTEKGAGTRTVEAEWKGELGQTWCMVGQVGSAGDADGPSAEGIDRARPALAGF